MRQIKNDKRLSAWLFAARNVCMCVGEETNDIKEKLRFPAFSGCKFCSVCVCVVCHEHSHSPLRRLCNVSNVFLKYTVAIACYPSIHPHKKMQT